MGKPAVEREGDTYNQHITRGFSDGYACDGERGTLITSTLRGASVVDEGLQ